MTNLIVSWNIFFLIFATAPVLTAVVKEHEKACSLGERSCGDGLCLDVNRFCDGSPDCLDRSDEMGCYDSVDTLSSYWYPSLNRSRRQTSRCRKNQWQCRDGNCISFDGKCDGVVDCPDGSDETHPLCRSERCQSNWFRCTYGACVDGTAPCNGVQECADNSDELLPRCRNETDEIRGKFKCENGDMISAASHCDGIVDCSDGSDETVRACAAKTCPSYLFQCAYGACVDSGADCNGVQECADNSDESDELCNRISAVTTSTTTKKPVQTGKCVLPEYPEHGSYTVQGSDAAVPGQAFSTYVLNVTCRNKYRVQGSPVVSCYDGFYTADMPKCIQCGRITPEGEYLIIEGRNAQRGELPWHAGIYSKATNPYMQICGGSLVSTTVVISAAHCFWSDLQKQLPAENYAVALGKLYRPWNNPMDVDAQKSDVAEIRIPPRFQGSASNFQEDIALVVLATTIEYKVYVRPVCINFGINFDRRQLTEGNIGKVAGWGLTGEDGKASQILQVVDLPYVKIETCIARAPPGFREYITGDKICAGYGNGTALCKGDSGGGLAFVENTLGVERYYLRGIVSTAPKNEHACNSQTLTSFTQIIKHEHFIREISIA